MWQKFTEKAREAVFFAQEEAAKRGSNLVGTEHLLLGVLRSPDSAAANILKRTGIDLNQLKHELDKASPKGEGRTDRDMQLSANAKRVIDLAYDSARKHNVKYIGTEHLLLGLAADDRGVAGTVLMNMGASALQIRQQVEALTAVEPDKQGVGQPQVVDMSIPDTMRGRDLISIDDLSADEIRTIFRVARILKARSLDEQVANPVLPGRTLAMIFEKPSLRTRVTFEAGMTQLGGHAIYLQPSDIGIGKRETVYDTAKNLERWVSGIMARTFEHKTVTGLAEHASVPVVNGLSDLEHPCQALADFLTIEEKKGRLQGLKLAYIGDGCNTCHSLMLLAAKVGADIRVGCPDGYEPNTVILNKALKAAEHTGSSIKVTSDPFEAAKDADAIYTDVWTSMGLEGEREERLRVFAPYQVNQKLVDAAAGDAIVLHCLPAHRGEEITDEVIDGPHSVVFDEAENRLHAQKAVMALLM